MGWTDPDFEYEEDDCCNMQTTETEGSGMNVNVTTEAYTIPVAILEDGRNCTTVYYWTVGTTVLLMIDTTRWHEIILIERIKRTE